ncbi:MAG: hypothetical protein AAFS10_12970, partial [Myxococcota bacterium]
MRWNPTLKSSHGDVNAGQYPMIDRDPVTEPAGDMTAAQLLIQALTWIDQGDDAHQAPLTHTLLHWKGRRIRDALGDSSLTQLKRRLHQMGPGPPPKRLERLVLAAGLLLNGPDLETFLTHWGARSDARWLSALEPLVQLLPRRQDRTLATVGLTLLTLRDQLPADPKRIHADGCLAEHFYRSPHPDPAWRAWFVHHATYSSPNRHHIAQSAAYAGHWDIVQALFATGTPQSKPPTLSNRELATALFTQAVSAPDQVAHLTQIALNHLHRDDGFMWDWCLCVANAPNLTPDTVCKLTSIIQSTDHDSTRVAQLAAQ